MNSRSWSLSPRAGGDLPLPSGLAWRDTARTADLAEIRRIVASTGFFHPPEIDVAVELVDERLSKGPASGYHFLFAEDATHVWGYACFGPIACTLSSYDLYWIAVDHAHRRQGLGRRLLAATEQRIRELGGTRLYIETSNRPQYQPTRDFYEAGGYRREATLIDFYAPGDDKVIYGKTLEPSPPAG